MGTLYGVLVTYRRPRALALMLARLANNRSIESLVVVDNDPTPENAELCRRSELPIEYVEAAENLGPAGGLALGMRRALQTAGDDDWVVLLDDDDPPPDGSLLAELASFAVAMRSADPSTAGVGLGGARFAWRTARLVPIRDDERVAPVRVDYLGGNRFPLYLGAAIRRVGVFRADFFFGFDDLEYGLRLRMAGYSLYAHGPLQLQVRRRLVLKHGAWDAPYRPRGRLEEPTWRRYYSLRNEIAVLRSHHRWAAIAIVIAARGLAKPLVNLPVTPRLALRHLALNARACRDALRGRMGRTVEPSPDAV